MFHQRLSSAYLPYADYSDYLVEQYQDIQDVCTTAMPELTTRGPFYYGVAPTSTDSTNTTAATNTATTTNTTASAICLGQTIDTGSTVTTTNATVACNQLSLEFSVSTGDLLSATGSDDCYAPDPVCLPAPCSLLQVPAGATWYYPNTHDLIYAKYLTAAH